MEKLGEEEPLEWVLGLLQGAERKVAKEEQKHHKKMKAKAKENFNK